MQKGYEIILDQTKYILPIIEVSPGVKIALFDTMSDRKMLVSAVNALSAKIKEKIADDFDVIVSSESKGIPLAFALAERFDKDVVIFRKEQKLYNPRAISESVQTITTGKQQKLWFDLEKKFLLAEKKVLIVDDVVSSGASLAAMKRLVEKCDGKVCGQAFVLAEDEAYKREDIIYAAVIPIMKD